MPPDTITIDAVGPMPVVRPATAAEVGEVVRRCAADGTAVYPVGGGTMLDYGLPPARPGVAVELRSLNNVIDFPASDMTITVEAGITIARLNEITRAEGLHLPIDVPDPERATLGGAIACNVSGPRRYGYGTFRDYILGITTVNDRGELVSAGGRVVKNVAGYDLMKLHTGALGTLGVITRVTLKLRPVPEAKADCWFKTKPQCLGSDLDRLYRTPARPVAIWLSRLKLTPGHDGVPVTDDGSWDAAVRFEGSHDAVKWQVDQLVCELSEIGRRPHTNSGEEDPIIQSMSERFAMWTSPLFLAVTRSSWLTNDVASRCLRSETLGPDNWIQADAGTGIIDVGFIKARERSINDTFNLLRHWEQELCEQPGGMRVLRCPSEWKKSLPVWGRPPADLALQKAVKRALDPQNILNPGRFVTDAL